MVRPIHLQDNLSKAALAGREQHIQQTSADLGQRQAAQAANQQHLLDQSRALQTTESDAAEHRVDDRDRHRERRGKGEGRGDATQDQTSASEADEGETAAGGSSDHVIDVLA
ncbi:hypothetical protein ACFL6X_00165 [Candidatus Latescibacterota bacterium]